MLASLFSSPRIFPSFIVSAIGIGIFSELYLGRTFAVAFSAGIVTIFLIFFLLIHKRLSFPKLPTLFFSLFIFFSICLTPFSSDLTKSMWEIIRLITTFFLFILTFTVSKRFGTSKTIMYFVVLASLLVLYDLFMYMFSGSINSLASLVGSFSWHNQMAGFLLLFIPILVTHAIATKRQLYKILFAGVFLLSVFAMLLTYSRGGWIILVIQCVLFAIFLGGIFKKNAALLLGSITLVVLFFFIFQSSLVLETLSSIPREFTENRTVSGSFRIETWKTSIEILSQFPLTGVGPGAFGSVFATFQNTPWLFAQNVHNHFLQVAVETGIFGLMLFLAIFIAIGQKLIATLSSSSLKSPNKMYFVGITIALFGSLLHSFIDYDFSTVSLFLLFFMITGLGMAMTNAETYTFRVTGINTMVFLYLGIFLMFVLLLEISEDRSLSARFAFENGRHATAWSLAKESQMFNPYNGKNYLLMSEILYTNQNYSLSRWYGKQAAQHIPYENQPYTILGALSANEKKYSESINWYKKAIQTKPYADPNQYVGLSYAYQQRGDIKQAEAVLNHAITNIFPLNQAYKEHEYLYFANGLTNELARLYIYLGQIKMEQGETAEATKLFNTVKERLRVPDDINQLE